MWYSITKVRLLVFYLLFLYNFVPYALGEIKRSYKPEYNIVFNGGHHIGKEKWRGPYHNKIIYTWFTAYASAKNEQEYRNLIDNQRKNGAKYIGYYYSATTSYPSEPIANHRKFPEVSIPPKAIKYSWILRDAKGKPVNWYDQKDRFFLNIGIKEVQDAILKRALGNTKQLGINALFLDNWAYKYWAPSGLDKKQWTEKSLSFLIRARELTMANNLKLVVNLTAPLKFWTEFAPYLDGISYEMGAHPYRLRTRDRYEEELQSYDKVMAMGKSIFLWTDRLKDNGERWDEDGRKVAATAMLVMPKDQPYWGGIYVANPRYEAWPVGGWAMWPEQLGKPLGPREWEGNTVTRKFERGLISVTVGEKPKFSIGIEF
jgi:hypothetical protein